MARETFCGKFLSRAEQMILETVGRATVHRPHHDELRRSSSATAILRRCHGAFVTMRFLLGLAEPVSFRA